MMFDPSLEKSVRAAFGMAHHDRHAYVTLEHLLLSLLDNDSAVGVLEACEVDIQELSDELSEYLKAHIPTMQSVEDPREVEPTLSFQRVLQHLSLIHI